MLAALILAANIGFSVEIEFVPARKSPVHCAHYNFVRFVTKKESRVVVYCGRPFIAGRKEWLEMTATCGMRNRRVKSFIVDGEKRAIDSTLPPDPWGAIVVDLDAP